jgi:PhnB protein
MTSITPMLSVPNPAGAADFYREAFGATELLRLGDDGEPIVVHLAIDGAEFYAVREDVERGNVGPSSIDGKTTVRIDLNVADPDAVAAQAIAAGATEMFPVADREYGWRQGRVVDPYGHHWLIGKPL